MFVCNLPAQASWLQQKHYNLGMKAVLVLLLCAEL